MQSEPSLKFTKASSGTFCFSRMFALIFTEKSPCLDTMALYTEMVDSKETLEIKMQDLTQKTKETSLKHSNISLSKAIVEFGPFQKKVTNVKTLNNITYYSILSKGSHQV